MDTIGGFLENLFIPNKNKDKGEDEIPVKPVEKPVEIWFHRKVTVTWKNYTEVFDNASDFSFHNNDLFYISFKDEDGNVVKKVYIPMREVIRFDVERIKHER